MNDESFTDLIRDLPWKTEYLTCARCEREFRHFTRKFASPLKLKRRNAHKPKHCSRKCSEKDYREKKKKEKK